MQISKAQIRRIKGQAIREYKQELRSKILCCLCATSFLFVMVGGVVYNFICF